MPNQRYLPTDDLNRANWLIHFSAVKEEHAATFGFNAASIQSTKNDAAVFQYSVQYVRMLRNDAQGFSAYIALLRNGPETGTTLPMPALTPIAPPPTLVDGDIFRRVARDVALIKNHKNYSLVFGQKFSIIGSVDSFDASTFKTTLHLKPVNKGVEVKFLKRKLTGINLYSRLVGESEWRFIKLIIRKGWIDPTPLRQPGVPERRQYKANGVMNNKEVGIDSKIVEIAVGI